MADRPTTDRLALGGVVGPVAFVSAWLVGAAATSAPYSSVDDAISRLAAVGADTRWSMTTGFIVFGVGVPLLGVRLRRSGIGLAWVALVLTGLATLGVAATPLDRSAAVDQLHGVFAGIGYLTLAAAPLLAVGPLRRAGRDRLAVYGLIVGLLSASALVATPFVEANGLAQRIGLTATDSWIVALAVITFRSGLPVDGDQT